MLSTPPIVGQPLAPAVRCLCSNSLNVLPDLLVIEGEEPLSKLFHEMRKLFSLTYTIALNNTTLYDSSSAAINRSLNASMVTDYIVPVGK